LNFPFAGLLDLVRVREYPADVDAKVISFEELQRDKRKSRAEDARRLATGEVTPEQMQRENSLIPPNARITIPALCETLERYYGNR
jgi:hypothetical protein